jgi:hypothetical protein
LWESSAQGVSGDGTDRWGRGVGWLASFVKVRFFGRKRGTDQPPAEVYDGLRQQVLHLTPDQLGAEFADAPILAVLMETGYREAVATLVGVADGTSSLYFSNGGGFIGAGTHAAVAQANRRWLEATTAFLPELSEVIDPPLPGVGMTQFVAVMPDGLRGAVAPEDDLGEGRHELSPFFHAAQDVITQIRLTQGG